MADADAADFPNPYRDQLKYLLGGTAVGVALLVVGSTAGQPGPIMGLLIAGVLLTTLGGGLSLAWWITARSLQGQLDTFRSGDHLARWEIEPTQWNHFAREMRRKLRFVALIVGGLLALSGVLTGAMILEDGDPVGRSIMIASGVGGVVLWLALRQTLAGLWKIATQPVLVVFGARAGVFGGKILSWNTFGHDLRSVSVDEAASRIVIETMVSAGEHDNLHTHRLPFPPTALEQARGLAETLRAEIGQ